MVQKHGCLPPPLLQNQRPLGIDRLEQIFRASMEMRVMELFLFHFRQTGYTLKQVILKTAAYGTVDPANLEAMLSTNFTGIVYTSRSAIGKYEWHYTDTIILSRLVLRPEESHHVPHVW